jgi:Putative DNA-binding domain
MSTGGGPVDPAQAGWATEAARQQALLSAIHAAPGAPLPADAPCAGSAAQVARGLAAYRANAHALAHRALAAACPTLEAMLGADELPAVARAFWQAHPPADGDIGEWGEQLPDWLAGQAALADWPWLPDAARLDLAVHRAERAADAMLDAASFALLGEHGPERLHLCPTPGLGVLRSAWPIVTMFHAHRALAAGADDALAPVRHALSALEAGQAAGETALVCRRGWRAEVTAIDPGDAAVLARLLDGGDLASALDGAGPSFDFTAWLQRALAGGWLKGVAVVGD